MNGFRNGALALAFALLPTLVWAEDASSTYEVRKGDTLSAIARRTQHAGVSEEQMMIGIYSANPRAFRDGNIHRVRVGRVLRIPGREEIGGQGAKRYLDGLALERRGDEQGAFKAFLDAGEGGYGLAQRRLGELYDRTDGVVERDYQTSLKWYQRAREQGVPIPSPAKSTPGRWY